MDTNQQTIDVILNGFGIEEKKLLGQGGEGYVYDYTIYEVIKVFKEGDISYLQAIQNFLISISKKELPFAIPSILEIDEYKHLVYTIEKKLTGVTFRQTFLEAKEADKKRLLRNYWEAACKLSTIDLSEYPYGQPIQSSEQIQSDIWMGYLEAKLEQKLHMASSDIAQDVHDYKTKIVRFKQFMKMQLDGTEKKLVHADYYIDNVLMDSTGTVSAVLDFGVHTVVGDLMMDIAGSIAVLTQFQDITKAQMQYLRDYAENKYGETIQIKIDLYILYFSFYFAYTKATDRGTYDWCIEQLNNRALWSKYL